MLAKLGPGRAVLGSTWDKTPWQPRHYVSEVETDLAELGKSPLRRVAQPQRAELMYALPQAVRHGRFGCLLPFCVVLLNLVLRKENEGVSVVLRRKFIHLPMDRHTSWWLNIEKAQQIDL